MPIKRIKNVVRKATAPIRWVGNQYKKEAEARKKQDAIYEWEAQVRANKAAGGYAGSVRRSLKGK